MSEPLAVVTCCWPVVGAGLLHAAFAVGQKKGGMAEGLDHPGRETIIKLKPLHVMSSGLFSHQGGWASLRPVTSAISLAMLAASSTVFLLPIVYRRPCITYLDHLLFA